MSDTTTARFRSRLNQLPIELKMKIGEISYQKGMLASSRKNKVIELLKDYNIPFLEVGTGTNRFIIKYDGYAIKIALDKEGIADNKQEWAISEELQPHAAYAWEISKGGHLLVASYIPAFTSYAEMCMHSSTIKKILKNWGQRYLLGDIGLSNINYANWGISPDGRPICIDYAYVFPASMDLFKCICGCKNMAFFDTTFSSYRCTQCGKKYEDRDLRTKISQKERLRLFENVQGIELTKEIEDKPIDAKYVKIDNDPDSPDPYDTAIHVAQMLGHFYD
jgi:hypothetical protein